MKKFAIGALIFCILSACLFLYRDKNVPPNCSSASTLQLAKQYLIEKFHFPESILISNVRTNSGGFWASHFACAATIEGDIAPTSDEPIRYTSEFTEDTHRHYVTVSPQFATTEEIPFIPCDASSNTGFMPAPKKAKDVPAVPDWASRYLALYQSQQLSVLAPRGWHCVGLSGSGGDALYVTPNPLDNAFLASGVKLKGPAIAVSLAYAGTSGRFTVARYIARLFPELKAFVQQVIDENIEPADDFKFGPYPGDRLTPKNPSEIDFETLGNTDGIGTEGYLDKDTLPISGTVMLVEDGLLHIDIRLDSNQESLAPIILDAGHRQYNDKLLSDPSMP